MPTGAAAAARVRTSLRILRTAGTRRRRRRAAEEAAARRAAEETARRTAAATGGTGGTITPWLDGRAINQGGATNQGIPCSWP